MKKNVVFAAKIAIAVLFDIAVVLCFYLRWSSLLFDGGMIRKFMFLNVLLTALVLSAAFVFWDKISKKAGSVYAGAINLLSAVYFLVTYYVSWNSFYGIYHNGSGNVIRYAIFAAAMLVGYAALCGGILFAGAKFKRNAVTPEETTVETPAEEAPEEESEEASVETIEDKPEETPEDTPEDKPEETPENKPEDKPEEASEEVSGETSDDKPQEQADAQE